MPKNEANLLNDDEPNSAILVKYKCINARNVIGKHFHFLYFLSGRVWPDPPKTFSLVKFTDIDLESQELLENISKLGGDFLKNNPWLLTYKT